ncbi:MAG: sulfite exporter TauE/SafE family protein [Planctomycetota bacterium]|nr:MAG: sulfite exporter TauE/SafE family protein [Planctomycetota bacterium]
MNAEWWTAAASAAWLGILTAISPCPLATNIAAISYIGRRVERPGAALLTGLLYALGRSVVYVAIAALLVTSVLSAPTVSLVLQKYMTRLLGPLLILVGMVLLGLWRPRLGGGAWGSAIGRRVADWGVLGGLLLGAVFALSFCPASAALYFAGLIPLAIRSESSVALPLVFGVSTALPVVAFAVLLVVSANAMARVFERVGAFERVARRVTGVVFVLVGVYLSLALIFRVAPATIG